MIAFTVYGQPQPAGSKRVVPAGGRAGGRPIVIDDAKGSRGWKQDVAAVALAAMAGAGPLTGPVELTAVFFTPRPKGHYGARGLRPSAPMHPTKRPDVLKLTRAVEDALTGIVWRDDAQVVGEHLFKVYAATARCYVAVVDLEHEDATGFDLARIMVA